MVNKKIVPNLKEGRLDAMKEEVLSSLSSKALGKLQEMKAELAKSYFEVTNG